MPLLKELIREYQDMGISTNENPKLNVHSKYVNTLDEWRTTFLLTFKLDAKNILVIQGLVSSEEDEHEALNSEVFGDIRISSTLKNSKVNIIKLMTEPNWKNAFKQAISNTLENFNTQEDFQEDNTEIIKNLLSLPITKFDSFLSSLKENFKRYKNLTPKQFIALKNSIKKYTPQVPLSEAQKEFLQQLTGLPDNRMTTEDKEHIAKVYGKACQGTPWTEEDRSKVLVILRTYRTHSGF